MAEFEGGRCQRNHRSRFITTDAAMILEVQDSLPRQFKTEVNHSVSLNFMENPSTLIHWSWPVSGDLAIFSNMSAVGWQVHFRLSDALACPVVRSRFVV